MLTSCCCAKQKGTKKSTSHTSITKTQRTHYAQFIFDTGVSLNNNKCTMQIAATWSFILYNVLHWRRWAFGVFTLALRSSTLFLHLFAHSLHPFSLSFHRFLFFDGKRYWNHCMWFVIFISPCAQYRAFSMTCPNRTIRLIYCLRYWIESNNKNSNLFRKSQTHTWQAKANTKWQNVNISNNNNRTMNLDERKRKKVGKKTEIEWDLWGGWHNVSIRTFLVW